MEMKEGKKDIIEGIREIFALWLEAGFDEDDTYDKLNLIDSETDQIIKGDIKKNFSDIFLKDQKDWEENYLKQEMPFINQLIDKLSQIPICEEKEEY